MRGWVVIPSRAGEKNKGLWLLAGRTLVEWSLKQTHGLRGCVTSDQGFALAMADEYFKGAVVRPEELRPEGTGLMERSIIHALTELGARGGDIVHVCQPTSPFLRGERVLEAELLLRNDPWCASVQTITPVGHNFHAWNQRTVHGDFVRFAHEKERREARVKQSKPERFAFGNLVSTRVGALLRSAWLFNEPCRHITIGKHEALDVDTREDLATAEAYVSSGLVKNPFAGE